MSNLSYAITAGIIMIIVFLSVCTHSKVTSAPPARGSAPIVIVPPEILIDLEPEPPYGIIE